MRFRAVSFIFIAALTFGSVYAADPPETPSDSASAEQHLRAARERLEQAAREVAELSTKMATDHLPDSFMFLGHNPNRAMLGIAVGGSNEGDKVDGVHVLSVSPGGPAATAGIKAGDVITELNGKSLKRDKDSDAHDKLMSEMAKLSPGDEVTLRYLRDGKSSTVKLKVDRLPHDAMREFRVHINPDGHDLMQHHFAEMYGAGMYGGAFGDMELAPLSSKLAQYFGADKGLLVVHAPQQPDVKLEDGDVLLDIDGRVPSNPGHAFRILGSYQPGEKLTINVLRQRKKLTIAMTVPEQPEHGPRPPRPPRPPTAPSPLTAPTPPVPPVAPTSTT